MVKMRTDVKRAYESPLRRAQAASTRRAIVEASTQLFTEAGYAATSIDRIALMAGVSRATVFTSVGGKAALLKAAYDVALVGDDEPVALPDRPESVRARAESDARRFLELYAAISVGVSARLSRMYEVVRGAAGADADGRAIWEKVQAERRIGGANIVGAVQARGGLSGRLDPESAADVVWILNDPGLYHLLVDERGWSRDRFEAWLAEALKAQLLAAPDPPS
jgi:AcrR family transcriptional regulator